MSGFCMCFVGVLWFLVGFGGFLMSFWGVFWGRFPNDFEWLDSCWLDLLLDGLCLSFSFAFGLNGPCPRFACGMS